MIRKIIEYSIKHKLMVALLVVTIIIGGLWAMKTISVDSTPDITNNQVQVITVAQNLSTTDIEQFITYPVEMAMANLPGVEDVRSVSRFGLSLVTVIFKDNMGTYLPRQLVQEKLSTVSEEIPEGMGSPEMGPITTGLGEIYLYSLQADTALYTPQQLRTIQDWTVRRQLSMIPGVVEVNSMGGSIKQYEIAFSPDRLNAAGVSIAQIFEALKKNNVNTGGAYIERDHQSHFIRGEGVVKNIDDIKNIVVKNMPDGMPVTVGDVVDDVKYGSQVRYGAFTQDGHEAVGGAIMMLKGSNSSKVIDDVKKRVAEVQRTLPPGVRIVPFLDRSDLIQRTTSTIARNLIEGALIVVFVLVVLLGSIRGGIITASLIPLSLLFAFILMRLTGVWANLMSLGAIDFGIIVDGAVIIVEGTVHELEHYLKTTGYGKSAISQSTVNRLTGKAAGGMMHSAFFGQIIILLVFTPILFLSGVSGKMFQPMAFTFAYALAGAILLCLTYVPMMTAVLNGPTVSRWQWLRWAEHQTVKLSRWIMRVVYLLYRPALRFSLKHKTTVIALTLAIFTGTAVLFQRMGGEFIPSLDEGDIAFQLFLRPGSSLSETVKRETEVERVLLKEFPEVKTVCGRIGVSAVPNDPMGMDFTDSFIILEKDKSKWKTAKDKKELLAKIEARLAQIPGITCAFSQPVELRTNELMTGIREDVAVKVYGENLDTLNAIGQKLEHMISEIPGAKDVAMERTSGLPQITVKYDRQRLAQYGLDVEKLNQYISTAFAGGYAGEVFEGEKRFALVLRLDDKDRRSINDLRDLLVDLPNGHQIPMSELASIDYQPAPMQISRDGASRRVYVGLNARGRDVASVVADIDQAIKDKLTLPSGYRIAYDGSFKNLQEATSRMAVVVPVALVIIFLLLYFALKSVVEALMIYVAVPLATLGGVIALVVRGMPFSISAGVGFIVLSGVAVLNGLVLINRFNALEQEGMSNIVRRIYCGTHERLRPIMLTAAAAMLGFLPMAISASAGAEVQRPLATVVIGGLFTSTMLTLVLLPVLYAVLKGRKQSNNNPQPPNFMRKTLTTIIVAASILPLQAQQRISLDEALVKARRDYPALRASRLQAAEAQTLTHSAHAFGDLELSGGGEEIGHNNDAVYTLARVRQNLDPFGAAGMRRRLKAQAAVAQAETGVRERELSRQVCADYINDYAARLRYDNMLRMDSLYADFSHVAKLRYDAQDISLLEYQTALNRSQQVSLALREAAKDLQTAHLNLSRWLSADTVYAASDMDEHLDASRLIGQAEHPTTVLGRQLMGLSEAAVGEAKALRLPKFFVEAGTQRIGSRNGYYAWQVGLSIPIAVGSGKATVKAARIAAEQAQANAEDAARQLANRRKTLMADYGKYRESTDYYRQHALPLAREQRRMAAMSYKAGSVGYLDFIQAVDDALSTEMSYVETLTKLLESKYNLIYY